MNELRELGPVPGDFLTRPGESLRAGVPPPESSGAENPFKKVFDERGDFAAFNTACAWLKKRGFSVGAMEKTNPIAVMHDEMAIAKWTKLDAEMRELLHAQITSFNFREGPVVIWLRRTVHSSVKEAWMQTDADVDARAAVEGAG